MSLQDEPQTERSALNRPNVLWIITDEQRVDSLSCYGSQWASSPTIDTLAWEGVRFENCITPSPVSVPARTALLTGRYPSTYDVLNNEWKSLPNEIPLTWLFRDAGYKVVDSGKCDYTDRERCPFDIYEFGPGYGASAASPWGA